MNNIMIEKRGYESALSACPAPAPVARPRVVAPGSRHFVGATTPFQGTGLPVAGQFVADRVVIDGPTMLVQLHPGDTARRPPA